MTPRALLLTPSRGLGGGIERYVETLESAFTAHEVEYARVDLRTPGARGHSRMLADAERVLRASAVPTRLVLAHRTLLPVACLLARERTVRGISVVCHGADVWGARLRPRWLLESHLMRRPDLRVVAVSDFTAGLLAGVGPATVLPPGLSAGWFQMLVRASAAIHPPSMETRLLTAFRLADWKDKGLPQILEAIARVGRQDVQLIVCGSGEPPAELLRVMRSYPFCTLRPGLRDEELARQFAAADIFVLATRTRIGRTACGEGFGLVLAEAQVAGTPVLAPAYGGSHATFIEGVTGVAPTDETVAELVRLLRDMLCDPQRLERMGKRAAQWAQEAFAPDRYAALAVARLL